MKITKLSPEVQRLRSVNLMSPEKKGAREKLTQQILSRVEKAMRAEISKRETKSGLILIEYRTEGQGVVGHSFGHGIETATVSHHYYTLVRFTSVEGGMAKIKAGYRIHYPPSELGNPFPRPRLENLLKSLLMDTLNVQEFVGWLRPKSQFEPYYSCQETHAIIVGPQPVGNRLKEWRKRFPKLEIKIP